MLLKLYKHEFKNQMTEMFIINAIMLALPILIGLTVKLKIDILSSLLIFTWVIFIFIYIGLLVNSIVKTIYKNIYTKEGYLTLTLPVTIDQIFISKYLVNITWLLIAGVTTIFGVTMLINIVGGTNVVLEVLNLIYSINSLNPGQFIVIGILFLASSLIGFIQFLSVLLAICAILNIGMIKKSKRLIGILMYMAFSVLSSLIRTIVNYDYGIYYNGKFRVGAANSYGNVLMVFSFVDLVFAIIYSVCGYIIARKLIQSKLELENSF